MKGRFRRVRQGGSDTYLRTCPGRLMVDKLLERRVDFPLRRHSQIGKAKACKALYSRFESGCRLHFFLREPDAGILKPGASGGMAYTADLKSAA